MTIDEKCNLALDLLKRADTVIGDVPPDENWYRDYFTLTGEHMILIEEGWVPPELNTKEVTGEDPQEVLDEVNAPVV
jgi:hypothetical protein